MGGGPGLFTEQFLRAPEIGCGPRGEALLPRMRHVRSDVSERTLREAIDRASGGARTRVEEELAAGAVEGDEGRPRQR